VTTPRYRRHQRSELACPFRLHGEDLVAGLHLQVAHPGLASGPRLGIEARQASGQGGDQLAYRPGRQLGALAGPEVHVAFGQEHHQAHGGTPAHPGHRGRHGRRRGHAPCRWPPSLRPRAASGLSSASSETRTSTAPGVSSSVVSGPRSAMRRTPSSPDAAWRNAISSRIRRGAPAGAPAGAGAGRHPPRCPPTPASRGCAGAGPQSRSDATA
jgi:hypothetical protein